MIEKTVFYLLAGMTLVPALLVVTLRNVFHATLWLIVSLTGVAGLFALMGSDFLFVAQLLIYAGGILILLLFVVLLSGSPKDWATRAVNAQWPASALVAAAFLALLTVLLRALPEASPTAPPVPVTASLGFLLLRDMVLPFEAVSLVLLAALVGAVHFSRREEEPE